jgi:hypothetical protein
MLDSRVLVEAVGLSDLADVDISAGVDPQAVGSARELPRANMFSVQPVDGDPAFGDRVHDIVLVDK